MSVRGKTVVVGVSGGIAAYKICETVRLLAQAGATVQVILTRAAEEFVTPLTLQTLSGHPVARHTFDLTEESEIGHIRLADTADALLVAPATANVVAKLAAGIADDLLTTVVLATRAPVLVAPAMNVHMWENVTVQANVARLRETGRLLIEPDSGALACGYEGAGRLPEPDVLVEEVAVAVSEKSLVGRHVLVTAGPTWEALDPVRHLANRSSGKMGFAVAKVARRRGARVTLVTGPTALEDPRGIECVHVTSAREMEKAALQHAAAADCVVMAAAVGDYRPVEIARHKIKRGRGDLDLRLTANPDILARISALPGQRLLVGFAAETRDLVANARRKLQAKGVQLMVANDVTAPDAGFDVDTNVVTLIDRTGRVERLDKMSKEDVAGAILDRVRDLRAPCAALRAESRRLRPRQ
ncbi:MAG: bifunctional phosphopantothenoylcysteine decarboxylase/phosphopantothenate--cysteine ligase CoaBC [Deltaproteobacteria bacterium]|nr:bifunctional phosphopantothenoylcysteine decarboxylase/phosphopantothenate--cysteine ligase CoaBC [Deltaproteobacteria bacterium]